jgi:hypothetical protein
MMRLEGAWPQAPREYWLLAYALPQGKRGAVRGIAMTRFGYLPYFIR